ncbi:hypothetical protein Pcinc_008613 [Petrolisthes cinctipes]|uniref:Uncharacterized protein n=1 Tax=Petrolisthes cinctipes TaxID=88211 RepID=A0AAE1G714_PETCI|nr:hypothetical protein Pcinc_008613 [Petrolisthes cinctipes]
MATPNVQSISLCPTSLVEIIDTDFEAPFYLSATLARHPYLSSIISKPQPAGKAVFNRPKYEEQRKTWPNQPDSTTDVSPGRSSATSLCYPETNSIPSQSASASSICPGYVEELCRPGFRGSWITLLLPSAKTFQTWVGDSNRNKNITSKEAGQRVEKTSYQLSGTLVCVGSVELDRELPSHFGPVRRVQCSRRPLIVSSPFGLTPSPTIPPSPAQTTHLTSGLKTGSVGK